MLTIWIVQIHPVTKCSNVISCFLGKNMYIHTYHMYLHIYVLCMYLNYQLVAMRMVIIHGHSIIQLEINGNLLSFCSEKFRESNSFTKEFSEELI